MPALPEVVIVTFRYKVYKVYYTVYKVYKTNNNMTENCDCD